MNPFQKYNRILMIPLTGFFLLLYGLACVLEPIDGDLTRLGAYWENDYGWSSVQKRFEPPLYDFNQEGKYEHYYDVVIVGDSFSIKAFPFQWQNYFARNTGLTSVTLPIGKVDVEKLFDSKVFRDSPPRLVILQVVERAIVSRLASGPPADFDCMTGRKLSQKTWASKPLLIQPVDFNRNRTANPFQPNFNESAHYIKGSVKRWYDLNIKSHLGKLPQTVRLPLNRNGLFSSRVQDSILLYRNDFQKTQVTTEELKNARCGMLYWQKKAQQNGTTHFVAMVAPDKTTAYEDHIRFEELENKNLGELFEKDKSLPLVPLQNALKNKIKDGKKDVYLPNDTHWGTLGHRTAAESLEQYLKAVGFLFN